MSILRARELSVGHGSRTVGTGISFELHKGEVLALLGPNGAGKTTLFRTILCLLKPHAGSIEIDGENLASWTRRKMARHLAYVPQTHSVIFAYSCLQMVLLGRTAHVGLTARPSASDHRIAEEALGTLGISDLRDRIYMELSGGERQLVLIARALAQGSDFLLMDEPTASLDFGNRSRVLKIIKALAVHENKGVILSTHDPNHAFDCKSTLLLASGKIIAQGPPAAVMTAKNLQSLYGIEVFITTLTQNNRTICVPF